VARSPCRTSSGSPSRMETPCISTGEAAPTRVTPQRRTTAGTGSRSFTPAMPSMNTVDGRRQPSAASRTSRYDGTFRLHWFPALPVHAPDGRIVKWIGIAVDIDEPTGPRRAAGACHHRLGSGLDRLTGSQRHLLLTTARPPVPGHGASPRFCAGAPEFFGAARQTSLRFGGAWGSVLCVWRRGNRNVVRKKRRPPTSDAACVRGGLPSEDARVGGLTR
jgi:hypothetical protein